MWLPECRISSVADTRYVTFSEYLRQLSRWRKVPVFALGSRLCQIRYGRDASHGEGEPIESPGQRDRAGLRSLPAEVLAGGTESDSGWPCGLRDDGFVHHGSTHGDCRWPAQNRILSGGRRRQCNGTLHPFWPSMGILTRLPLGHMSEKRTFLALSLSTYRERMFS
jgi:hypothetical protein